MNLTTIFHKKREDGLLIRAKKVADAMQEYRDSMNMLLFKLNNTIIAGKK